MSSLFYSYFEINFALRIKDLAQRGVAISDTTPLRQNENARNVRVRSRHSKSEYRLSFRFTPKVRMTQTQSYLSCVRVSVKNPLSFK